MSDPLDNREIRKLLRSLPGKAIRILWDQHHAGLFRIALQLTHDHDTAKDIVQDTFCQVWANAAELSKHHERSIEHYLVRIVRNKSITHFHEQVALNQRRILFANGINLSEQSIENRIIQIETTRDILEMIRRFPRRERQCLSLKLEEELTNREISTRLGVGLKAVERSLTSAKKRLRGELQKRFNKKI